MTGIFVAIFTGALAAFVPAEVTGEMMSIGTLFAFMLVCAGVMVMRIRERIYSSNSVPVPAVPFVAILGIITCLA